jgi:SOS-response transcriptional repressor LexA
MSTFAQRIKQARLEAGLSQEALAEAMSQLIDKKKISRTAITQWESSKTKGIEAANLLKATKVLNIMPDWLQFGRGSMRPLHLLGNRTLNACFVPLLSYTQAVNPMEKDKEIISILGLDEYLAKVASPRCFALVIKDSSMVPAFSISDIIIIDPHIQPYPGEFVAARLANSDCVLFRKYRPLLHNNSYQFELIALNEDWSNIIVNNPQEGEIIGTLIEHRCRRRMQNSEEIFKDF